MEFGDKNFPALHGALRYTAAVRTAHHRTLPWSTCVKSTTSYLFKIRFNIILLTKPRSSKKNSGERPSIVTLYEDFIILGLNVLLLCFRILQDSAYSFTRTLRVLMISLHFGASKLFEIINQISTQFFWFQTRCELAGNWEQHLTAWEPQTSHTH
jgi:hypothetical protein